VSGHDQPDAVPLEIELRFIAAAGLPNMATLGRLQPAGMKLIERGQQRLHSDVYIDTPRFGLRAAGANLRIRRCHAEQ